MKVALDTNVCYVTKAGMARYLRGLQLGFSEVEHREIEIVPLAWKVENFSYQQPWRAMKTLYREFVWPVTSAPWQLYGWQFDLLHTQGWSVPRALFAPQVSTLHDLASLRNPFRFRRYQRMAAKRRFNSFKKKDRIICISKFTADEAHKVLGIPYQKMEVIYHGVEELLHVPLLPINEVPKTFFLFVGSLEPGKNLGLLKDVYLLAEQQGINLPLLLIVGARWQGVQTEGETPKAWRFMGRLSDGELKYLYQKAYALLFPSIYEGFGFPPLEAMLFGCPTICGRMASIPEVCGDAAIYAKLTPETYLQAVRQLLSSSSMREEMVQKGRVHVGNFTWKKCAEQTLQVYRTLIKRA
jgi:glycosyltransferase involved in cell wall biosynthesis